MNRFFSDISRSHSTLFISLFISVAYALLMYLKGGYYTYPTIENTNPVWNSMTEIISETPWVYWINFAVYLLGSRLVFKLNEHFGLSNSRSMLPFIFFITLFINNPALNYFSESTIILPILFFIIFTLFNSYQKDNPARYTFLAGAAIGIGAIFWIRILLYIPSLLIGLSILRCISFRSFITFILGVVSVLWCEFAYLYCFENAETFTIQFQELKVFAIPVITELLFTTLIFGVTTIIIGIFSVIYQFAHSYQEKVRTQSYYGFIILIAITSCGLLIFNPNTPGADITINNLCVALLASSSFSDAKTKFATTMFLIIIITYNLLFWGSIYLPDFTLNSFSEL